MRPRSLAEVATLVQQGASFDFCLRNFLDEFRRAPDAVMLQPEPIRLQGTAEQGEIYDAYLAATAESLASESNFATPAWAWGEDRKLRRPWFTLPWAGIRAVLLLESPAPFRSRNLFVSENALSRA